MRSQENNGKGKNKQTRTKYKENQMLIRRFKGGKILTPQRGVRDDFLGRRREIVISLYFSVEFNKSLTPQYFAWSLMGLSLRTARRHHAASCSLSKGLNLLNFLAFQPAMC